jgi:RNase adapter protein RapZ
VDNLPVELIPRFAELSVNSEIEKTALVVDIREGNQLRKLPGLLKSLKKTIDTKVIFLEASDDVLIRRFSETRRPHPLGKSTTVPQAIATEREALLGIRGAADFIIDTSKFNVHDLRAHSIEKFRHKRSDTAIAVSCVSFGYKHGVPQDCDLLFDVRFLPNPHFEAGLRERTGLDPEVAAFVLDPPRTAEFMGKLCEFIDFLIPRYEEEGKAHLTVALGCTGGQHRSVAVAQALERHLSERKIDVRVTHRDVARARRSDV